MYSYVRQEGENLVIECRLFDVLAGNPVVGQAPTAKMEWKRFAVHLLSDDIVKYTSGVPGIATSQIVFSGGATGKKEIYAVDYDGANLKKATSHQSISIMPRLAPDGNRVAYLSYKDRYPFLYVLNSFILASALPRCAR